MSTLQLNFNLVTALGSSTRAVPVRRLIVAGWTGRDKKALEAHIAELEKMGVKRPATTPIFYRASASRLTFADAIEAVGGASSGEAEFILVNLAGDIWVGTGSDHTDREVETYNVTVSKQMCDKPIARDLWPLAEVAPHWDRLTLASHIIAGSERTLYQEGTLASMLAPDELIAQMRLLASEDFVDGDLMFCGTLAARGGIRPADHFAFSLTDPVLGRSIAHGYDVLSLADAG